MSLNMPYTGSTGFNVPYTGSTIDRGQRQILSAVIAEPEQRFILFRFFEMVESHVISHTPLAVTYRIAEGSEANRDFTGLTVTHSDATLCYVLRCSCGQQWSITRNELSNPNAYEVLHFFCRSIDERYADFVGSGDGSRQYFDSDYYKTLMPTKKEKKEKPEKTIDFDNAIEGLEI